MCAHCQSHLLVKHVLDSPAYDCLACMLQGHTALAAAKSAKDYRAIAEWTLKIPQLEAQRAAIAADSIKSLTRAQLRAAIAEQQGLVDKVQLLLAGS